MSASPCSKRWRSQSRFRRPSGSRKITIRQRDSTSAWEKLLSKGASFSLILEVMLGLLTRAHTQIHTLKHEAAHSQTSGWPSVTKDFSHFTVGHLQIEVSYEWKRAPEPEGCRREVHLKYFFLFYIIWKQWQKDKTFQVSLQDKGQFWPLCSLCEENYMKIILMKSSNID